MRILRRWRTEGALLAAAFGFAMVAHAACTGPQTMTAQLRARPTTDNAVLLGSWYASHQQFGCALETFRGALKRDPKSAQLHYLTGLALLASRQSSQALTEIEESIHLDGSALKPHIVLASLYDDAGRHTEAEAQWRQALAIDPKSEQVLEGLSTDMMKRQDYASVVQLLQVAPRNEKLSITLAQALGLRDQVDAAGVVLADAMGRAPGSLALADAATVVLIKQHKYQDAINLLQHMVDTHPGSSDAQLSLFRVLVLTNHMDVARPWAPKLLAERPHDPEVLYLNGVVDRSFGDYAKAKEHLQAAINLQPDFFYSRYDLGMVLVFLHEWQPAMRELEKAITLNSAEPQVHFELAKALRGLGDNAGASEELKIYQQLKLDQESTLEGYTIAKRGDDALQRGKLDEAITYYRDAIQQRPSNASYKFKLAIALTRNGDVTAARSQLEEAVKIDPSLAGAQNALGYLLSRSGDTSGAVEHFRKAVEAEPGWTEAWINLAAELAMDAQLPEARQAVAKALALEPGNAQARELRDHLDHAANTQPRLP